MYNTYGISYSSLITRSFWNGTSILNITKLDNCKGICYMICKTKEVSFSNSRSDELKLVSMNLHEISSCVTNAFD